MVALTLPYYPVGLPPFAASPTIGRMLHHASEPAVWLSFTRVLGRRR